MLKQIKLGEWIRMEKYRLYTVIDGVEEDTIYQGFQTITQIREYMQVEYTDIEDLKEYARQIGYALEEV